MKKTSFACLYKMSVLVTVLFSVVSAANAQQTTEQYIPIGSSPGVSGKYSYIGRITAVDRAARTISLEEGGDLHIIKLSDDTHIWLDRSKVRGENRPGDYEDCEVGRRVEVMHEQDDKNIARWIKIETR